MTEGAKSVVDYLKPEVIRRIERLDLRAKFVVEGFISGLHGSPFHGFSVEFSEHREYEPGDPLKDMDWALYGRTDRYYLKKYQAETTMSVYVVVDASPSMDFTTGDVTKFDYSVGIAAALSYLAIRQNDPVGLVTFSDRVRAFIPPRSRRSHLMTVLSTLAKTRPEGRTRIGASLHEVAELVKHRSMILVFSDFMEPLEDLLPAIHHLAFRHHDIVLFHVLDPAELDLPFDDLSTFTDMESGERLIVDPAAARRRYREAVDEHNETLRRRALEAKLDYVRLDTATPYDRALTAFLLARR